MLKSTFKKVSAIAIAGTMLAGMMAVPANAMTEIMEDYQKPVWSENFNGYEEVSKSIIWNSSSISETTLVEDKITYSGNDWMQATIKVTGETDKKLIIKHDFNGNTLNLKLLTGNITLPEDMSSNISFDASIADITDMTDKTGGDAGKGVDTYIGVNDTKLVSFTHASTKTPTDKTTVKVVGASSSVDIVPGTTYSFNIEIDNGVVTLTIKNGDTVVGTSAASISGISSISNILFTNSGYKRGYSLTTDNIVITTGAERGTGKFVSDLSKTVLDENFDNVGDISSGKLQGTSFTVSKPWGANDFDVKNVNGAAQMKGGSSSTTTLLADVDDVVLGDDEVIRFSFDTTKSVGLYAGIRSTSITDPKVSLTSLDGNKTSSIPGDKGSLHIHHVTSEGYIRPGICQTVTDPMMLDGYTYHFEYTIDPSNRIYDNKQTLTVRVTSPDNALANSWQQDARFGEYKETLYLDADCNTEGVQKFDSLSAFYFKQYWNTTDVTIDNLKVEVLKPGFEVKDVANSGNTYSFNSNDPIELNYLADASAASKVVIAQYAEGGRMINAETKDLAATGAGTVTVTPVAEAQKIKVMILDMSNALPYTKAFVMTRQ